MQEDGNWAPTFRGTGFPGGSAPSENPPANAGDAGLIPGLGRSPVEGNGVHSSVLAWRIPWRLAGYSPWGHKRAGHYLATKQQQ